MRNGFIFILTISFRFGTAWLGGFFGVFGFNERFQIGEAKFPELAVLVEPSVDGAEWLGIQTIDAMTAFAMFADEMGATQQAEVLGNGRTRDWKGLGDGSGGLAAAAQEVEDGAAGGIGQRLKRGFRSFCRGTCNRTVPHDA
jgi:hypothetical protein